MEMSTKGSGYVVLLEDGTKKKVGREKGAKGYPPKFPYNYDQAQRDQEILK